MSISKWLMSAVLVCVVGIGSACTQKAADQTTNTAGNVVDEAKEGADTALDATREGAATAVDETKNAGEETAVGGQCRIRGHSVNLDEPDQPR